MRISDSTLDVAALDRARVLLAPRPRRERLLPVVLAATALALTSLAFATVMVLAPPAQTEHVARGAPE